MLDLHAEGFDPRMTVEDEPDRADRDKVYSAQVGEHMARIRLRLRPRPTTPGAQADEVDRVGGRDAGDLLRGTLAGDDHVRDLLRDVTALVDGVAAR